MILSDEAPYVRDLTIKETFRRRREIFGTIVDAGV